MPLVPAAQSLARRTDPDGVQELTWIAIAIAAFAVFRFALPGTPAAARLLLAGLIGIEISGAIWLSGFRKPRRLSPTERWLTAVVPLGTLLILPTDLIAFGTPGMGTSALIAVGALVLRHRGAYALHLAVSVPAIIYVNESGILQSPDASRLAVAMGLAVGGFAFVEGRRRLAARRWRAATIPFIAQRHLMRAMEAKKLVFAGLAHDLRTPLNLIMTAAESTSAGVAGPVTEEDVRRLDGIQRQCGELDTRTFDLLETLSGARSPAQDGGALEGAPARDAGELAARAAKSIEYSVGSSGITVVTVGPGRTVGASIGPVVQHVLEHLLATFAESTPIAGIRIEARTADLEWIITGPVTLDDLGIGRKGWNPSPWETRADLRHLYAAKALAAAVGGRVRLQSHGAASVEATFTLSSRDVAHEKWEPSRRRYVNAWVRDLQLPLVDFHLATYLTIALFVLAGGRPITLPLGVVAVSYVALRMMCQMRKGVLLDWEDGVVLMILAPAASVILFNAYGLADPSRGSDLLIVLIFAGLGLSKVTTYAFAATLVSTIWTYGVLSGSIPATHAGSWLDMPIAAFVVGGIVLLRARTLQRHAEWAVATDAELRDLLQEIEFVRTRAVDEAERLRDSVASLKDSIDLLSHGSHTSEGARTVMTSRMSAAASSMSSLVRAVSSELKLRSEIRVFPSEGSDTTPVSSVLVAALPWLESLALRRGVTIKDSVPPELDLPAAAVHLEQVLSNIVTNAIKVSEPGGTITISGGVDPDSSVPWFRIHDDGPGMPEAQQAELFQLFEQSDSSAEGWGVGLAVVAHVAQRYGASVGVDSELGSGTAFTIRFPPVTDSREAESQPPNRFRRAERRRRAAFRRESERQN